MREGIASCTEQQRWKSLPGMKHGAITLQKAFVVNKKHVPQLGLSGTHERFVYNLDFHLWLGQFPPGHKHEQRGQYRANGKKKHNGSPELIGQNFLI